MTAKPATPRTPKQNQPQRGNLRLWAQDSAYQCDAELRIHAEDVGDFISGLAKLVDRKPAPDMASAFQQANGDSQPLTDAERSRRYRERKRNERDENVTHDAPRNDENVTPDAHALLEEPGGVE